MKISFLIKVGAADRAMENSQTTQQQNQHNGYFLSRLHLQAPQPGDRQDQNRQVGEDIRRRGDIVCDMLDVDTFAVRV